MKLAALSLLLLVGACTDDVPTLAESKMLVDCPPGGQCSIGCRDGRVDPQLRCRLLEQPAWTIGALENCPERTTYEGRIGCCLPDGGVTLFWDCDLPK